MASSGNFATLNPLVKYSTGTFSNGNLTYASGSDDGYTSTIGLNFKSYCEVRVDAINSNGGTIGFRGATDEDEYFDVVSFQENYQSGKIYHYKGSTNTAVSIANIGGTVSAGNIIMMAYDPATYKWWVGVNGTWRNSGDPANGTGFVFQGSATMFENMRSIHWGAWNGTHTHTLTFNFGQDSTFGGQETAGGNADGNGFGDFKYSVPTGFLATCSGNMVLSDDIDPAQTDDDYPQKQFNTVLYTGDASTNNPVTGLGFQPDMVWIKSRGTTNLYSNAIFDSSRGRAKIVFSDSDRDEDSSTSTQDLVSFDSDGFTVGTVYNSGSNINNDPIVAWCWKGAGGTTASNGSGSTTSTVQANTKAGFSIMTYTGTGSNATIGHGLSAKPDLIFTKRRSSNQTWGVYHSALGATKYLALNSNAAAGTDSAFWNDTEPTSTLISLGTEGRVNANSQTYVAYAWHNVEGYSKFGSYEGNADDDGPFVYTGFRPRMLWIKEADNADDWVVYDTARSTSNPVQKVLRYETYVAEFDGSGRAIDILSNGFKIRTSNNTINQSNTFVYGCFGDVPFKYNNTF